ncbi:SOS response-associated peptidase family protein [Xanthomonas sp. 60]
MFNGDNSGVSANIHDRIRVLIPASLVDDWLAADPDEAMAMLLASQPPAMEAYRVSRAVNTPRNNGERLLQAAS